ncbi:unnamed protein product [Caenorhabditis auriculariae]|uniref:Uncharacterized protein n=1 Tax=Caenorhabditis auriculariae TaxID=2777116 RepID=A0A8S1GUF9_9PELO|nr:unnamed protein product [Caenorhabditis auriculariae]
MTYLYIQHFLQCVCWFIQRLLFMTARVNDIKIETDFFFLFFSITRSCCLFSGLLVLPALIIERSCATYFLSDYEKSRRSYIWIFLTFSIVTLGIVLGYTYHYAATTFYHVGFVSVVNSMAFLGNLRINWLNRKYHHLLASSTVEKYSLAERFQVSENIRACKILNNVIFAMVMLNFILLGCLSADSFDIGHDLRHLTILVFDFCVFYYSFVVPYIMFYHLKKCWRFISAVPRRILRCWRPSKVDVDLRLTDTFGANMMSNNKRDAAEHFENLTKIWALEFDRRIA